MTRGKTLSFRNGNKLWENDFTFEMILSRLLRELNSSSEIL